ncbi:MAG: MBL fold metallo-hydrolase [Patescibacteria group bacterium]|jgi:metallo-beta-lactamase family protein
MRLTFHGGVEDVTGSCFLLETSKGKLLIDCGMLQGERMCSKKNLEPFGFNPAHISAVVVTHAHFDHTGRLPDLVKQGYEGKIFMTPPTKALTQIILEDSVHIMAENARKCGDPVPYEAKDLTAMLENVVTVPYHHVSEMFDGVSIEFFDAGHILGSSFIRVVAIDGEEKKTFVFSGDIGNDDVPILPDTESRPFADVLICESTYGGGTHEPTAMRESKLSEFVKQIIRRGGTVLLPAFSVERTQEILFAFDQLLQRKEIPEIPIYLDSPLAIKATTLYRHYTEYLSFNHPALAGKDEDWFRFPSLTETPSVDASKVINNDHRPKIIIAGNGMMTGGRIMHHLARYIEKENTGILIVGYQAKYTLGKTIQSGAKEISIFGEKLQVHATVETIDAFSAHGDQEKLTRFVRGDGTFPKTVFLVHGESETKDIFAEHLRTTLGVSVEIPRVEQVYEV